MTPSKPGGPGHNERRKQEPPRMCLAVAAGENAARQPPGWLWRPSRRRTNGRSGASSDPIPDMSPNVCRSARGRCTRRPRFYADARAADPSAATTSPFTDIEKIGRSAPACGRPSSKEFISGHRRHSLIGHRRFSRSGSPCLAGAAADERRHRTIGRCPSARSALLAGWLSAAARIAARRELPGVPSVQRAACCTGQNCRQPGDNILPSEDSFLAASALCPRDQWNRESASLQVAADTPLDRTPLLPGGLLSASFRRLVGTIRWNIGSFR
jgi:hypothetical protein